MELSHYFQWKLDIKNLVQSKAWLLKNYHLQPSEVNNMDLWEWQLLIDEINDLNKHEQKEQKEQESKYKEQYKMPSMKLPQGMPKVPNIKYW